MTHLDVSNKKEAFNVFVKAVDEYKKSIRQKEPEDAENLKELDYCRRYSKTRSMGQE